MAAKWTELKEEWTIKDIGAPLLDSLARGLYSALEVFREYAQNAIDSYVDYSKITGDTPLNTVQVRIDPDNNALFILDSGVGMDRQDVLNAKSIAVSHKLNRTQEFVGFRGIGIWSGLSACDRLEIVTTKVNDPHEYKLVIDCKEIVEHVYDPISVDVLLQERFHIYERAAEPSEHYTSVKLVNVHRDRYGDLLDRDKLSKYAAETLPVPFDPAWVYTPDLVEALADVSWTATCDVRIDGDPVFRRFPGSDQIKKPSVEPIRIKTPHGDQQIGVAWVAETNRRSQRKSLEPSTERGEVSNFAVRVKNFAIGRRGLYSDHPSVEDQDNLDWYVGEIYITDNDVTPDTNRRMFQSSHKGDDAITALRDFYSRTATRSRGWSAEASVRDAAQVVESSLGDVCEWLGIPPDAKKSAKPSFKAPASERVSVLQDAWAAASDANERIEELKAKADSKSKDNSSNRETAIRTYLRKPEVKNLVTTALGQFARVRDLLTDHAPEALKPKKDSRKKGKGRKRSGKGGRTTSRRPTGGGSGEGGNGDLVPLDTVKAAFLAAAAAVLGQASDGYRRIAARLDDELKRRGIGVKVA